MEFLRIAIELGLGAFFFVPKFPARPFQLGQELVSLGLLPLQQLIEMGVGFLQFLDASVAPIDLRGRAHRLGRQFLAQSVDRFLKPCDLFSMLNLVAPADGQLAADIFAVGDAGV